MILSLVDSKTIRILFHNSSSNITFPSFEEDIFPGVLFLSYHRSFWMASTLSENCSIWSTSTISRTIPLLTIGNTSDTYSRFDRLVIDHPRLFPPTRIASQFCITDDLQVMGEVNETIYVSNRNISNDETLLRSLGGGEFNIESPLSSLDYCFSNDYSGNVTHQVMIQSNTCRNIPEQTLVELCILEPPRVVQRDIVVTPSIHSGQNRTIYLNSSVSIRFVDPIYLSGDSKSTYGQLFAGACEDEDDESLGILTPPLYVMCYRTNSSAIPVNARLNDTFTFLTESGNQTEMTLILPLRSHFQPLDAEYSLSENDTASFSLHSTSWIQSPALFHYRIVSLPSHGVVSFTPRGPSIRLGQLVLNSTLYYTPNEYFASRDTGLQFVLESCGGIITDPAIITFAVSGTFSGVIVRAVSQVDLTVNTDTGEVSLNASECITLYDLDENTYNHTIHAYPSKGMFESYDICPAGCATFSFSGSISMMTEVLQRSKLVLSESSFIPGLDGIRFDVEGEKSVYCRFNAISTPEAPETDNRSFIILAVCYSLLIALGLTIMVAMFMKLKRPSLFRRTPSLPLPSQQQQLLPKLPVFIQPPPVMRPVPNVSLRIKRQPLVGSNPYV